MNKVLVVDIGNSFIKFALFNNDKLTHFFTPIKSDKIMDLAFLKKIKFDTIILSSVVSNLTKLFIDNIRKICDKEIINIASLDKKIKLDVKVKKEEIGDDLLADLIAAKNDYKKPAIIFDIGTVNKVLALNSSLTFIGCSFFPGLLASSKSLFNQTDALPHITDLSYKNIIIGKDTFEAISSGIINSTVYSMKGFISDYKKIIGKNVKIILTGGGASFIKDRFKNIRYDKHLTVKGIYYIYKESLK